jgi:hypothetical protein
MRTPDTRPFRYRFMAAACVAVIALASACGTAEPSPVGGQGAAPSPTYDPNEFALTPTIPLPTKGPRTSPVPEPTQDPNAGIGVSIMGTYAPPPSPEQFAQWYGLIITGTVIQVFPAQWSTSDGKRPPDARQENVPNTYMIITPAIIKLDSAPLVNSLGADVASGRIVVTTFGGQVGKDQCTIDDPSQHLEVGQHLLLGLTDHPLLHSVGHARYYTPAGQSWNVGMVYTLTDDGKANPGNPRGQPVSAADFIAGIISAATKR